jgi:HSP20 family molecular chaperone IbpA
MRSRDLSTLLLGEALSMLEQADRLQRQFFRVGAAPARGWEPPVDVLETADAVFVQIALPGVRADSITVSVEPDALTVSALRPFVGGAAGAAQIHRVEIPYGRFERRIALPMHALELAERSLSDGCLTLALLKRRAGEPR